MLNPHAPDASPSEDEGPARRLLTLGFSCAITLALVLGCAWRARERLRLAPEWSGNVEATALRALSEWRTRRRAPPVVGAVLFGDSRVDCQDGVTVGTALAARLRASGRPVDLVEVARPALRPLQFYYLLGEVLAGAPAVAIIEVNPGYLWPYPPPPLRSMRYFHLSRRLSPRGVWRMHTPLAVEGVSLLDPFIYGLEEKLDLLYVGDGVRDGARLLLGLSRARSVIVGSARWPQDGLVERRALTETAGRGGIPAEVADHPVTLVLRELYRELRRAGVEVLFYVPPQKVEQPDPDEAVQSRTVEAVRDAVGAMPLDWLDLHARLTPEAFRDANQHLHPVGCERVADAIGDVLVPRLR